MILAVAILALAALVAYGRGTMRARPTARLLVAALAAAAAVGAVYEGLRGVWLGALLLIAAALWLGVGARPVTNDPTNTMSRADAASLLGVAETASPAEVEAAYRRLIRRAHPDAGGTAGLAAQLNAARTVLRRG